MYEVGVASLTLWLRPLAVPYATAAATDVVAMLKAVGINVTVSVEQPGTWIDSVFLKADYDLSIVSHARRATSTPTPTRSTTGATPAPRSTPPGWPRTPPPEEARASAGEGRLDPPTTRRPCGST